jgi:hypothetical protein
MFGRFKKKFQDVSPLQTEAVKPTFGFSKPTMPRLNTLRIIEKQWQICKKWEMVSFHKKSHPSALSLVDSLSVRYYSSDFKSHADVMITDQLKSRLVTSQLSLENSTEIEQSSLEYGYPLLLSPTEFDPDKAYHPVKLVISDNPTKSGFEDNQVYLDVKHWVLLPANTKFCKKNVSRASFVEINMNDGSIKLDDICLNKEIQGDTSTSFLTRYEDRFTLIGLFEGSAILVQSPIYEMRDGPNFQSTLCVINGQLHLGSDYHFNHFLTTQEQDQILANCTF